MSADTKFPIHSGILQDDLDCNNKQLLNFNVSGIFGTAVQRGIDKEVWIAKRTDAKSGTGTKEDPFDGSTQALLDAKLAALLASSNIAIHVGPGTFTMRGGTISNYYLKSNVKIYGAGMDVTTLQFDSTYSPTAGQQIIMFPGTYNIDGNGNSLKDITIDMNSQNTTGATSGGQKNFKMMGCYWYGSYNTFENVRIKNCYGSQVNGLECFDLGIEGLVATAPVGNKAIRCIAETPRGNYHCGILCAANPSGGKTPAGYGNSAISCITTGYNAVYPGTSVGISANEIIDCQANGCMSGFRWEPADNLKIIGNTVLDNHYACIDIEDSIGANNVLIFGNTLEMRDDGNGWGIWATTGVGHLHSNFQIDNNTFLIKAEGGSANMAPFVGDGYLGMGWSITNNKFQRGVTFQGAGIPADIYSWGNRYLDGGYINDLPDGDHKTITFTPVGTGWHRIATGVNRMGGQIYINDDFGGNVDETVAHYEIPGYGQTIDLTQVRSMSYNGKNVDQIRGSSTGGASYLDIHVTALGSITIDLYGKLAGTIVTSPVSGAVVGTDANKSLSFGEGLRGTIVVATHLQNLSTIAIDATIDPTDNQALSYDAGSGKWKPKSLTGTGAVATDPIFDAKGDLAVGTGADTSAKLTVGANDTVPVAASGEATGLKYQKLVNANIDAAAAIAESKLNLASDAAAGTASRRSLGTTSTTAAAGNDSRFSSPTLTVKNADYTFVLADNGNEYLHDEATARAWTIPANASVAFPAGAIINGYNNASAGNLTIAITSDTLRRGDGIAGTGSRTVAANSGFTLKKIKTTEWMIFGKYT